MLHLAGQRAGPNTLPTSYSGPHNLANHETVQGGGGGGGERKKGWGGGGERRDRGGGRRGGWRRWWGWGGRGKVGTKCLTLLHLFAKKTETETEREIERERETDREADRQTNRLAVSQSRLGRPG